MKPHQKKSFETSATLANSSGKPNMQKQSENLLTNYIIVDEKVESAKEKCEISLLKEAPASVMNISTKFVTDNRKARLKKSKKICGSFEIKSRSKF